MKPSIDKYDWPQTAAGVTSTYGDTELALWVVRALVSLCVEEAKIGQFVFTRWHDTRWVVLFDNARRA